MEKEKLLSIIKSLPVPQEIKQELIANADLIDEEDLLSILEDYTDKLDDIAFNNTQNYNSFNRKMNSYEEELDYSDDQIDIDYMLY